METIHLTKKDFELKNGKLEYCGKIKLFKYRGDIIIDGDLGVVAFYSIDMAKLFKAGNGTSIYINGSISVENLEIEDNIEASNITIYERAFVGGTMKSGNCIDANRCIIANNIISGNCVTVGGYIKAEYIKTGNRIICDTVDCKTAKLNNTINSYKDMVLQEERFFRR